MTTLFVHMLKSFVVASFKVYPQLTNGFTGFFTFSSGDLLSQKLVQKPDNKLDFKRAAETGLLGIMMNGVILHHWYKILEKTFGSSMIHKKGIILKMLADQALYAPFSIFVFFGFTSMMQSAQSVTASSIPSSDLTQYVPSELLIPSGPGLGVGIQGETTEIESDVEMKKRELGSRSESWSELESLKIFKIKMAASFLDTWMKDCFIWPFVNVINFRYIPVNYRPSFVGVAQLIWQTFMSSVSHDDADHTIIPLLEDSE